MNDIRPVTNPVTTSLLVRERAKPARNRDLGTRLIQSLPFIRNHGKLKCRVQLLSSDTGVQRIAFKYLNPRKRAQDVEAVHKSLGYIEKKLYLPLRVTLRGGKEMTILVNERSFRQRYLSIPEDKKRFAQLLKLNRATALNSFLVEKQQQKVEKECCPPSCILDRVKEYFNEEIITLVERDFKEIERIFTSSGLANQPEKNSRVFSLGNKTVVINTGKLLGKGGSKTVTEGMMYQYNERTGKIEKIAQCALLESKKGEELSGLIAQKTKVSEQIDQKKQEGDVQNFTGIKTTVGGCTQNRNQSITLDEESKILTKQIKNESRLEALAKQELAMLNRLKNSPNMSQIHGSLDYNRQGKAYRLFIEDLCISDLFETITEKRSKKEQVDVCLQLANSVKTLHNLGYIHRDIKSYNFLVDPSGDMVLTDFEVACETTDQQACRETVGTFLYLPPEILSSDIAKNVWTEKGDIWSLGIVFYEILHRGNLPSFCNGPFSEKNSFRELHTAIATWSPKKPNPKKEPLKYLTYLMLQKDPAKRITAARLVELLNNLSNGQQLNLTQAELDQ